MLKCKRKRGATRIKNTKPSIWTYLEIDTCKEIWQRNNLLWERTLGQKWTRPYLLTFSILRTRMSWNETNVLSSRLVHSGISVPSLTSTLPTSFILLSILTAIVRPSEGTLEQKISPLQVVQIIKNLQNFDYYAIKSLGEDQGFKTWKAQKNPSHTLLLTRTQTLQLWDQIIIILYQLTNILHPNEKFNIILICSV